MFNIAIDGPAGAGKSTIAKDIAKRIGFVYVDTGAMFRSIALYMLNNKVDPNDEAAVSKECPNLDITISYLDGEQQVILNGENVSKLIRTEEVGNTASIVAKYQAVRSKLLELQRALAAKENVIMDGRDIGSFVLPNADLKVYLTASSHERARRRVAQLAENGITADFNEVEADIIKRDEQDMNREIAPLKQADDAVLVDSSDMSVEDVINKIISLYEERK
ncbi:MAG: (d)CMP kinase [Lachnospiraceae bacterium]|nr:(d)CMP kinase [Lachnospiraceae bacterium]